MPANMATQLPARCPGVSWSKKNSEMPAIVRTTARTSAREKRFFKNSAEKTTMNIGAVNCRTMEFAAVVSLLAATKQVKVRQRAAPPARLRLSAVKPMPRARMYTNMTSPAMRLRRPAMTIEFHGISFIKMPAMLHSAAHSSISSIALFLVIMSPTCKSGGVQQTRPRRYFVARITRKNRSR